MDDLEQKFKEFLLTVEEAMNAMERIMWKHEKLWVGESYRVTDGTRLHPYNQICFVDAKGGPQMDWRGEFVYYWPVMDDESEHRRKLRTENHQNPVLGKR